MNNLSLDNLKITVKGDRATAIAKGDVVTLSLPDEATKQIQALVKDCIPEKRNTPHPIETDLDSIKDYVNQGYNQAIHNFTTKLKAKGLI